MIKKPKMILFDYGQTLIVEPQFDWTAANLAILSHASHLPEGMSAEEFCECSNKLFEHVMGNRRENCREIEHEKFLRLLCDIYGLKLDISIAEADLLYWDSATHGSYASPGAAEFLDYLYENGIRTGVISNMCYANMALRTRLNRYLPNNRFEFVLTSSDYVLRKPEKLLFDVAIRRAGLAPDEIWYIGDNPVADVVGSNSAGMHPVLYTGAHMRDYSNVPTLQFDTVDSFAKLKKLLEKA
ncbi:MAG: HAD family hydrolase [Ruminococcaceae bacterium]|nr:HAD family hydrolase [Oscillospiraceae bacterium]